MRWADFVVLVEVTVKHTDTRINVVDHAFWGNECTEPLSGVWPKQSRSVDLRSLACTSQHRVNGVSDVGGKAISCSLNERMCVEFAKTCAGGRNIDLSHLFTDLSLILALLSMRSDHSG